MAAPFLRSVADYVHENYKDNIEKLCIVLPNKRGALFLKHHLSVAFNQTIWLPTIISAEELIAELSGLKTLEEIDLICHLYESYSSCYGSGAEAFDSFAKWGQLILQDFNEIDRYLADPKQLYENLKDIKEIENWSLGAEFLTEHQTNYLQFMNSLGAIYQHFTTFLLEHQWAYQGLAYRTAVEKFDKATYPARFHKIIFCGFNALNAAELKIFNGLLNQKKADLLWDADEYYLNDVNQEAGLFLRRNMELFPQNKPKFINNSFKENKSIKIVSVPRQIGQAQVVKQAILQLIGSGVPLDKVAVVLANEKLLWPVLQQLPNGVEHVNITMEYPLRYTSTYSFIDAFLQVQLNFWKQQKQQKTIYHRDLVSLLRQPLFQIFARAKGSKLRVNKVISDISERNLSFISQKQLNQLLGDDEPGISALLRPLNSVAELCNIVIDLLHTLVTHFSEERSGNQASLELEYLEIILRNFNRLGDLITRYHHFNDLQAFRQLYNQVVGNATAPFIGEPLKGLQVMGVLETRTLDFDHVILVNVNEGVLPSGKTINSFIPNDLKRAFGMPLYLEKDAIYAYHFYRLLQRASDIVITYDSETDTFGKGEKSRFLTQLELEMKQYNSGISITEEVATYETLPQTTSQEIVITKNHDILDVILQKAVSNDLYGGLSPSGLITYKECPLKFYFRYGARLKETKEVEESAEANTFGSILHLSLERLYTPFKNNVISPGVMKDTLKLIDATVNECFSQFFGGNTPAGKSLLQQEVIKVYVRKLVQSDIHLTEKLAQNKGQLSLTGLEQEFSAPLAVQVNGKTEIFYIKGKIDRLDTHSGKTRIIDYKSSVKATDKFVFSDFEKLFNDKTYNKQLQLIIYAWLVHKNTAVSPDLLQPCIFPFKAFTEDPIFIQDPSKKPFVISTAFLTDFEKELTAFISSVFDQNVPFIQTSDNEVHKYCPYNTICNFPV